MAANYNNSAWFYDKLSRLVYGRALINAQVYLLQFIPKKARILIVGGGTGWILEEITRLHPTGLNITYIEVASKMIARSKKRNVGGNRVTFIHDAIENVPPTGDFDVIITPFLFDSFTEATLEKVFGHIHSVLNSQGLWLYADFQVTKKWWQRSLLKLMLNFFKLVCNIEASRLPDVEKEFGLHNYTAATRRTFLNGFVIAIVYEKM